MKSSSTSASRIDVALLLLRLGLGFSLAIVHGYGKLRGGEKAWAGLGEALGIFGIHFAPTFWGFMAMAAEFFGGILLAIGLLTRPAAAMVLVTMIVAAGMHLSKGDAVGKFGEIAVITGGALCLLLAGPGRYSVAALVGKGR